MRGDHMETEVSTEGTPTMGEDTVLQGPTMTPHLSTPQKMNLQGTTLGECVIDVANQVTELSSAWLHIQWRLHKKKKTPISKGR